MEPSIPDLRSLLKDATPSADEPVGDDGGVPEVDEPAAVSQQPAPQQQQPGESAQAFLLRQKMEEAGFNVSDFQSDEEAFTEWLGLTRELHQNSQEYVKHKDEFEKWRASGSQQAPQHQDPTPEDPPASKSALAIEGVPTDMDPAVSKAIQDGFLKPDDKGFYTPIHPSLNGLAEIANKSVMESRRFAQEFVHRPVETQKKMLQALLPEMLKEFSPQQGGEVESLKAELAELKAAMQQQQQQASQNVVRDWVKEHASVLFVNGDLSNRKPTAVGREYLAAEEFAKEANPDLSQQQLHEMVLNHLKRRGVKLEAAEPARAKQPATSFMSGANGRAATTRPNGVSLSDFAGNAPATNPPALSTRGLPDLNRVIAVQQSQATSN